MKLKKLKKRLSHNYAAKNIIFKSYFVDFQEYKEGKPCYTSV